MVRQEISPTAYSVPLLSVGAAGALLHLYYNLRQLRLLDREFVAALKLLAAIKACAEP